MRRVAAIALLLSLLAPGIAVAHHEDGHSGSGVGGNGDGGGDGGGGDGSSGVEVDRTVEVVAAYQSPISYSETPATPGGPAVECNFFFWLGGEIGDSSPFGWTRAIEYADLFGTDQPWSVQIRCWVGDEDLPGFPQFWDPPEPPLGGPGDVVELPRLEIYAREAISFETPVVVLSPAADQVVGVPTWLAVSTELDYAPVTANAGPFFATARAEFRDVTWDMGDGSPPVVCTEDVALTFDPDLPVDEQDSRCTHTYESNGPGAEAEIEVTATVAWRIFGTRTGLAERELAPITRSITFVVDVRELQAVID